MKNEHGDEVVCARVAEPARNAYESVACLLDYEPVSKYIHSPVVEGIDLGAVSLSRSRNSSWRWSRRTLQHIRVDHADHFIVSMPRRFKFEVLQNGSTAIVLPDHFTVLSTAKPFVARCESLLHDNDVITIAGSPLRKRLHYIDHCCGQALKVRAGSGRVMQMLHEVTLSDGNVLTPRYAGQLANMIVDSLADAISTAPELSHVQMSLAAESSSSSKLRLREEAINYIDQNMSNPELQVADIARHCNVSASSLYAAFADTEMTINSYLREERLQRCREMLLDRTMRNKLIIDIALMWGFCNAAHFSQLYRTRFGRSPKEERQALLQKL